MGYTHNWYRPEKIEGIIFKAIVKDFRKVLKDLRWNDDMGFNINLAGVSGEGKPVISSREDKMRYAAVGFNGIRENDQWHESFTFDRTVTFGINSEEEFPGRNLLRHSCKTNEKPYDIAVTTFLVIAKHYLGNKLVVESDGGAEGFKKAVEVVHCVLGYRDFYLGDNVANSIEFNPEPPLRGAVIEASDEIVEDIKAENE